MVEQATITRNEPGAIEVVLQIRKRLVETAVALMEVGERLHRARELLPHGTWLQWLVCETGMSEQWSRNCIDVFLRFRQDPSLFLELDVALAPTAVIRLATAPDAAYDEIVGRVRAGERLRVIDVEQTIRHFREGDGRAAAVRPPGKKDVEAGRIAVYQVVRARPIVLEIADVAIRLGEELKSETPNLQRLRRMVTALKRNANDIQGAFSDYLAKRNLEELSQDGRPPDAAVGNIPVYSVPPDDGTDARKRLMRTHREAEDHES